MLPGLAVLAAALIPAAAAQAAYPGADGAIAFHSDRSIYTIVPGQQAVKLPEDVPGFGGLSISGDGLRVVYDVSHEIASMNIDGSGFEQLTKQAQGFADNPSVSSDGKQVAFERGYGIWVMNADGGNAHSITPDADFSDAYSDPAWSPDGTRIAYTFHQQVWTMAPDGSAKTDLTPDVGICPKTTRTMSGSQPDWSPDGKRIVFTGPVTCANSRGRDIWVMNADGSGKAHLTADDGSEETDPVFSPSGGQIAFNRSVTPAPTQLVTMSAGGGAVTPVTTGTTATNGPAWGVAVQRVKVAEKVAPAKARVGKRVVISGRVSPASTGKVTLLIKRKGAKAIRKTARLKHSKFRLSFKATKAGRYSVVATYPTGNHRLGASSKSHSFKVRK